jgi:N-acetylated-alpha-linked acidic dipeptidase
LLAQLKSYGLDAQIEVFAALFPTSKSCLSELFGPASFKASLQEPALSADPTQAKYVSSFPPTTYTLPGRGCHRVH